MAVYERSIIVRLLIIFVSNLRRLDYETRAFYRFAVVASRDVHKTPPTVQFLASVEVVVNVTDVNECRAEFEQPVYRVALSTHSPIGHQVRPSVRLSYYTLHGKKLTRTRELLTYVS